jgi:hypothetical protein
MYSLGFRMFFLLLVGYKVAQAAYPGGRMAHYLSGDNSGNMWLFGGNGYGYSPDVTGNNNPILQYC